MKGRRREGARTVSHSFCDCCGGPHPFGVRFSAVVPCVCACHLLCACACWACCFGPLGGCHLSMADCVSGNVRMGVRAHGMKEWRGEGEFDLEGIWTGLFWLRWTHARRMCFRIMGRMRQGFPKWPVNAIRVL
ncbi:exo-alpha-sialidase [Trypanosoma cruzi]|nr:exo-alpha-sialidase [Trypanosoma cruzi]